MADEDKSKILLQHDQIQINAEMQADLNRPLKDNEKVDPKDKEFLKMLVNKIENKEIDLYQPSSLINHTVYDNLDAPSQGRADYDAFNLLATIREIYKLWLSGNRDSFQIFYLVSQIRLTKERLEEVSGDIYII